MAVKVDERALTADLATEKGPIALEKIDPKKAYRAVIQLGARRRWRTYGGGKWARDETLDADGANGYRHVPALHETGPISGETLRGLVQGHNDWVRDNRTKREIGRTETGPVYAGDVSHQLLVVDFNITPEPPEDIPLRPGSAGYLETIIKAVVKSVMAEMKK